MLEYIMLAFFAGVLVKIVDFIEDDARKKPTIKWPLAVLYGLLIGYLISQAPFSMIFLAAVLSQILMRKVDTSTHILGFFCMALSMLYFGLPEFLAFPFIAFLIFSTLDELDHLIFWKKPIWVQDFRPFLELAAIPFLFLGQWYYLAGILAFDVGYLLVRVPAEAQKAKKGKK